MRMQLAFLAIAISIFCRLDAASAAAPALGEYQCKGDEADLLPSYTIVVSSGLVGFSVIGKPTKKFAKRLAERPGIVKVKIKAEYFADTNLLLGDFIFRRAETGEKVKADVTGSYDDLLETFTVIFRTKSRNVLICKQDFPACNIAGTWTHKTGELAAAKWTFSKNDDGSYDAEETGLGFASGTATMQGHQLHIGWTTLDQRITGTYDWTIEENCRKGTGTEQDSFGNNRSSVISKD